MRFRIFLLALLLAGGCAPVAEKAQPAGQVQAAATGIAGRVNDRQGQSAVGAYVYAYRSARGGLRGPADFEALVGADGRYFLDLVEGRYHLVARLRPGGSPEGPPRPGDGWALAAGNPVAVRPAEVTPLDFVLHGISQPMLLREGSLGSGDTGFSGRLIDGQGRPLPGALVLAYGDEDFRRMPDYTSPAADEDGRFILYVPRAGRYCLAARTKTRGQPMAGEPYAVLGRGDQGCRRVDKGQILEVGEMVLSPYRR